MRRAFSFHAKAPPRPVCPSTAIFWPRPSNFCANYTPSRISGGRASRVSWFWLTGAVALSLVPVAVRNATGGGIAVEAAISGFFAFGIGAGSIAAAVLRRGRISLAPAPRSRHRHGCLSRRAGVGRRTASGAARPGDASSAVSLRPRRLGDRCRKSSDWRRAGGLFVVPLFAAIQARAAPEDAPARSRQ